MAKEYAIYYGENQVASFTNEDEARECFCEWAKDLREEWHTELACRGSLVNMKSYAKEVSLELLDNEEFVDGLDYAKYDYEDYLDESRYFVTFGRGSKLTVNKFDDSEEAFELAIGKCEDDHTDFVIVECKYDDCKEVLNYDGLINYLYKTCTKWGYSLTDKVFESLLKEFNLYEFFEYDPATGLECNDCFIEEHVPYYVLADELSCYEFKEIGMFELTPWAHSIHADSVGIWLETTDPEKIGILEGYVPKVKFEVFDTPEELWLSSLSDGYESAKQLADCYEFPYLVVGLPENGYMKLY